MATDTNPADGGASEEPEAIELESSPPKWPVSVSELRQRLGQTQTEEVTITLAPYQVISTRVASEPIEATITLESAPGGVVARGTVSFIWQGECRRCLEDTTGMIEVAVDERYETSPDPDGEAIEFDGDYVDLVPLVAEAAVLSLPLAPLCREDCAGPDPDRYPARTEEELEAERKAKPDPRWAGLADLDLTATDEGDEVDPTVN